MDKVIFFAVAGAGKTTHIINSLSAEKRSLIITYTNNNFENLSKKIADKFCGKWPYGITLMTFFQFLYRFCYKPFLSDIINAKGIIYEANPNQYIRQNDLKYFLSPSRHFYSNRLSFFFEKQNIIDDIKGRIEEYYDEFIIDEIQDIAGRDFEFLDAVLNTNVNMLFVGDFYQHTFDTSRDGNVNKSLFDDKSKYEGRFIHRGVRVDKTTLLNSWRCGPKICDFISTNLKIMISSNKSDDPSDIVFVRTNSEKFDILNDPEIIKLHFKESYKYGFDHKNWGDTKGEDCYHDVCVMLNKETMKCFNTGNLSNLAPSTRNKLYVAITRAHRNVYLIEE